MKQGLQKVQQDKENHEQASVSLESEMKVLKRSLHNVEGLFISFAVFFFKCNVCELLRNFEMLSSIKNKSYKRPKQLKKVCVRPSTPLKATLIQLKSVFVFCFRFKFQSAQKRPKLKLQFKARPVTLQP